MRARAFVLAAAAVALAPVATRADLPATAQHLPTVPLAIHAGARTVRFRVEVARTPDQQEIGLMFRKALPARAGMVFPMDPPRMARFWMKNTLIPLDILFVRPDHVISSIAANATPLSLATIDSTEPVAAVLELNGGAAARAHIRPGDSVRW